MSRRERPYAFYAAKRARCERCLPVVDAEQWIDRKSCVHIALYRDALEPELLIPLQRLAPGAGLAP